MLVYFPFGIISHIDIFEISMSKSNFSETYYVNFTILFTYIWIIFVI